MSLWPEWEKIGALRQSHSPVQHPPPQHKLDYHLQSVIFVYLTNLSQHTFLGEYSLL